MNKKIGSIPQLYVRHCYALPSDYAYVAPLDIKKDKTMNDLQKTMLKFVMSIAASNSDLIVPDGQTLVAFINKETDKFQSIIEGYFDSPGFENEFGKNVPNAEIIPILELSADVYIKNLPEEMTMNDLQKMQTLAFWHGLLVATIENQIELHKEEPDIFEVPSAVTFDWALKLLDDHLDATDEMDSALMDYVHEYGDIDDEVFKASYLYFLRLHTKEA